MKLKIVEDDPLCFTWGDCCIHCNSYSCTYLSRPPPLPILPSVMPLPVVSQCILNASILHQRRHFQVVSNFIISLPPSHTRRALGVTRLDVGMVDLVIADIPENMPVPNVSDPTYSVPSWNISDPGFLGESFDFADEIIHMMELSASFTYMIMVTSRRAIKTTSLFLASPSSRSG